MFCHKPLPQTWENKQQTFHLPQHHQLLSDNSLGFSVLSPILYERTLRNLSICFIIEYLYHCYQLNSTCGESSYVYNYSMET